MYTSTALPLHQTQQSHTTICPAAMPTPMHCTSCASALELECSNVPIVHHPSLPSLQSASSLLTVCILAGSWCARHASDIHANVGATASVTSSASASAIACTLQQPNQCQCTPYGTLVNQRCQRDALMYTLQEKHAQQTDHTPPTSPDNNASSTQYTRFCVNEHLCVYMCAATSSQSTITKGKLTACLPPVEGPDALQTDLDHDP